MTTRWLTQQEREAWLRFAAVLELLPGVLDAQLSREEGLTHFDYFTLAMLSEAPHRTLRMTELAGMTNATLPRLSRVISRLESDGLVERRPCPQDRRATNAVLTELGWAKVRQAAPSHVENVRRNVLDTLTPEQVEQLSAIAAQLLRRLDPDQRMYATPQGDPGLGAPA
jgi:DNA-binding MarR family transcriptional regulator